MNARKALLMTIVVGMMVVGFAPAHAAQTVCVTNATVTLTTNENLTTITGGFGTLSGSITCAGDVSGTDNGLVGNFGFCSHRADGTHYPLRPAPPLGGTAKGCWDTSPENTTDPIYGVAAQVVHYASDTLVAHINGNISVKLDSGVTCSFALNGHTLGTIAELEMKGFKCSNGFGGANGAPTARSQALSEIIFNTNPCPAGPAPACFQQLTFQGLSEALS
ncbi:MAG: hypothetical protein ACYDCC_05635 [Actinomycetota bacterium]